MAKLTLLGRAFDAFVNHGAMKANSIETNGEKLFSYGWFVIAQWIRGEVVLRKGGVPSVTTVRQQNQLEEFLKVRNIPYRHSTEESNPKQSEMKAERPPSLQGVPPKAFGCFAYSKVNATWEEWRVSFRFYHESQGQVVTIAGNMTQGEAQTLCDFLNNSLGAVTDNKGE